MAINPRHILDFIQHFVRRNNEKCSGLEEEQLHKGTSAEDNIQAAFEVFSRLGEDFMRHLKMALHAAGMEREEPYLRLNNYLMQFRGTSHGTMRKSPEERLLGRKFGTKLPNLRTNPAKARKDIVEAKEYNERVQVQARRSHGKVERLSRYLDKANNGAGDLDGEGRGREVQGHDTVVGKNKAGGAGRQGRNEAEGAGRQGTYEARGSRASGCVRGWGRGASGSRPKQ